MVKQVWLERAHLYMMNSHTWFWEYDEWNHKALSEFIFWYACAGQAIGKEVVADRWLEAAIHGRLTPRDMPPLRKRVWEAVQDTVPRLLAEGKGGAFRWFSEGNATEAVTILDSIPYIGPKIASWVLRDLSCFKDYARGQGHQLSVTYDYYKRNSEWFSRVSVAQQAAFLPLDLWVIEGAHAERVIPRSLTQRAIQANRNVYRDTAEKIVRWARERALDPRDLDMYWYLTGIEDLKQDGSVNVTEDAEVWFRFPTLDSEDWREGTVVRCGSTSAEVQFNDGRHTRTQDFAYEQLYVSS